MLKAALMTTFCAGTLLAQGTQTAQPAAGVRAAGPTMVASYGTFGPIGITAALAGPTANIQGAPYSAQAETERVQILADGNRIEQTTSSTVARDGKGRVRRDETLPALEGNAAEAPRLTFIEDPVAGFHWTLDPRTKTAMKMPFAPIKTSGDQVKAAKAGAEMLTLTMSPGVPAPPPPPPPLPVAAPGKAFTYSSTSPAVADFQIMKLQAEADSQVAKTDLGTQTIQGVPAQGTRLTRTIAAGKIGNAMPIVITTETWYSPDLKVLVMSKSNDPRMGETTYRLTGLQRAEPAATLFEIPSDYTVREGATNFFFRTGPKPQE